MSSNKDNSLHFLPPLKMYHLTGGLSLLQGSNNLSLIVFPGEEVFTTFSVKPKNMLSLFSAQPDIKIIGRNYFESAHEMKDFVNQYFSISEQSSNGKCLAHEQSEHWSGMAVAFNRLSLRVNASLVSRIRFQIELCLKRLERLSITYRSTFEAVYSKEKIKEFPAVKLSSDKYATYIGSEIRSFLNELYSLRDAVLNAVYVLYYKKDDPFQLKKLKALTLADKRKLGVIISGAMFSDSGDQLIEKMSLYRAVAQHCLGTTNPLFNDVYQLKLSKGPFGNLPYLVYPLYDDFEKMRSIENDASKGVLEHWAYDEEELKRFALKQSHTDGLQFCFDCFVRLLRFSEELSKNIEIEPETISLADKDILEARFIHEGKAVHLKRNPSTGKLEEL